MRFPLPLAFFRRPSFSQARGLKLSSALLLLGTSACTTMTVAPVDPSLNINFVCIQRNPKVIVSDFLPVVQDGFQRHKIATEVFDGDLPETCQYILTYTAHQKWDFTLYLSHAELALQKDKRQIAHAIFHLKGGGGLAFTKWDSTKKKMDPVIDALLKGGNQSPATNQQGPTPSVPPASDYRSPAAGNAY